MKDENKDRHTDFYGIITTTATTYTISIRQELMRNKIEKKTEETKNKIMNDSIFFLWNIRQCSNWNCIIHVCHIYQTNLSHVQQNMWNFNFSNGFKNTYTGATEQRIINNWFILIQCVCKCWFVCVPLNYDSAFTY